MILGRTEKTSKKTRRDLENKARNDQSRLSPAFSRQHDVTSCPYIDLAASLATSLSSLLNLRYLEELIFVHSRLP
jgi:hypothetical protein